MIATGIMLGAFLICVIVVVLVCADEVCGISETLPEDDDAT